MGVYVYCIREDYRYQSSIKGHEFENEWFKLAPDGTVIVRGTHYKGYAWNRGTATIFMKPNKR